MLPTSRWFGQVLGQSEKYNFYERCKVVGAGKESQRKAKNLATWNLKLIVWDERKKGVKDRQIDGKGQRRLVGVEVVRELVMEGKNGNEVAQCYH